MITEKVRAEQERAHKAELVGMVKRAAKRGDPFPSGTLEGHEYTDGDLSVSSHTQVVEGEQGRSKWAFVQVTFNDREVFVAGALIKSPYLPSLKGPGNADYDVQIYRPGDWERRVRSIVKLKPRGKH